MKKLFLSLAIVGVAAANASAQQDSATLSADIGATIVKAITLAKTADMSFGKIVATATATPVVLTPAGVRTSALKFGNTAGLSGTATAASFTVTGEPDALYAITLPVDGAISITAGAGAPMTVTAFNSTPTVAAGGVLASGTGLQTLLIGATLNVGVSQVTGAYTGSFPVTVTYN